MNSERPAVGVSHLTVVPSNFQPDGDDESPRERRD
jgi:hypothetical protein